MVLLFVYNGDNAVYVYDYLLMAAEYTESESTVCITDFQWLQSDLLITQQSAVRLSLSH